MRWFAIPVVLSVAAVAACGSRKPTAEEQEATRHQAHADSVVMASRVYDAAMFDTIQWKDETEATERGGVVWVYSCQECHGQTGAGNGGKVAYGDTLRPPSFLAADWHLANQPDSIRMKIYTGTAENMPHWGLVGLGPKDIDAVTQYILKVLRGKQ